MVDAIDSIFKEGEEHFIWQFYPKEGKKCLAIATLSACDHCKLPATTNAMWITAGAKKKDMDQAYALSKKYKEFTELGADSNGDCFCENCYPEHAVVE